MTPARSQTLALSDGGRRRLVRVSETGQVAILRQVCRAFGAFEFSGGAMEPVAE